MMIVKCKLKKKIKISGPRFFSYLASKRGFEGKFDLNSSRKATNSIKILKGDAFNKIFNFILCSGSTEINQIVFLSIF
jgi:hypothetical protein